MKPSTVSLLLLMKLVVTCRASSITFYNEGQDVGSRLILTPYIESRQIEEGRQLSKVNGGPFPSNIHSYSGFFTVNTTYNSNLFFWFFPSEEAPNDAPLLLWLQGGPGSTSMFGLFTELGPFRLDGNLALVENPYSWHKNHSVLFIDNPVGTGFSFTESEAGYARDQFQIGNDLYSALVQFLTIFSEFQSVPLFIAGESYAGKYVPALALTIHQRKSTEPFKINLEGIAVGNGFTDPESTLHYSELVYQLGLVDTRGYEELQTMENNGREAIRKGRPIDAVKIYQSIQKVLRRTTNFSTMFNFIQDKEPDTIKDFQIFVNKPKVRKAIHVGNAIFDIHSSTVVSNLLFDFMTSLRPWLEEVLEHYRVLYYSGQLDIIVGYALSVRMYNNLDFSAAQIYRNASRVPWYVDGELAGYMKSAGKFTEVLVRNAGHMVPADQPKWALDLISRFTRDNLAGAYSPLSLSYDPRK
ncbi:hypothetical protein L9F63_019591 [Diploptera punctata]|uniref:Carboxypeptidase n=1 Tax=Diploptera punctata TaxID=6984 RepID=A0AAD7ZTU8_DIPPU|nr:hypothetical protein L9F63_019591 [Diploptera punctata]